MDSDAFLSMLSGAIGSRVSVVIDAGLYKGTYKSRIEDVSPQAVGLAHPTLRGALLPVHRSVHIKINVETGGALYITEASIVRGITVDSVPILWVAPVGEAIRMQRRQFVRVPCLLKTGLFRLAGEEYSLEKEEWATANAKDISLGGMGFAILPDREHSFVVGERYLLDMAIGEKRFLLVANLVKKLPKGEFHEVGMAFESVPALIEKALRDFIRQQELAERQL
ncbi:MAG: PilZ domain-containing protein [Aminobacteriaceae bacterium]